MPIGVIVNSCSILLGGLVGAILGNRLENSLKENLTLVFGVCSMGMGVNAIMQMQTMPAVIFSIVVGTALGLAIHLGDKIQGCAKAMQKFLVKIAPQKKNSNLSEAEFLASLVTILVLFCASGTGIYGSLEAGMTGDNTILISKSILDFFTAAIFACSLGTVVSLVAIPQFVIFSILFFCATFLVPLTSITMIADFKACGGFLILATGFRIAKIKQFPIADMILAMVLVMPISWIWTNWIMAIV